MLPVVLPSVGLRLRRFTGALLIGLDRLRILDAVVK